MRFNFFYFSRQKMNFLRQINKVNFINNSLDVILIIPVYHKFVKYYLIHLIISLDDNLMSRYVVLPYYKIYFCSDIFATLVTQCHSFLHVNLWGSTENSPLQT